MGMEGGLSPDELASMAHSLMAAKMFSLASCVMLYYDIALTFGQEVERIWMRKLSFMTVLWCMNRYLSPLGYIVIIVSFHSSWSKEVCNNYVLYPEALKVVTSFAIGVIFITRLYAIYSRSLCILILDGTSLQMPPGFVGCILVGKHHGRFVLTWIAELVFDSAVFFLTFWRTAMHSRSVRGHGASLYDLVLRDGVIYFAVIFAANLMTVLFFLLAPPNLKAIN
ncbi:hypothetical protein CPC08DRAFT_555363 [Agrocybe pediades]|nr:hypothetical protein CPC08DRAFT_555363 [Agrocybe pediades]